MRITVMRGLHESELLNVFYKLSYDAAFVDSFVGDIRHWFHFM